MRDALVQDFARAARSVRDMRALGGLLRETAVALGFHHVLLQAAGGEVLLADLPEGWVRPLLPADAALAAAAQCFAPFLWSDICRLIACSQAQRDFLVEAASCGVGAAVTVPVHRTSDPDDANSYSRFAGACSFLMKTDAALPLASLAAAHYVGALAFDAAEAMSKSGPEAAGPQLTPRQRDCVALVAQGKSDWEVGRLLGISESTVHKHIEDAKRRFGVSTRIQLVVRSLGDAKLSFAEVFE
jgi:LuxR family quorum-sensing system transcriptional regulator CciR